MAKWRILIVDDEEDIRSIVRAALSAKYEVVEAVDGLDALEKLELAQPDFVILDVMMPMMNGFEACAAIRRHPAFKDISVLFLSALNTKEDMMKGYASGANLYLTKPFDPARLVRNVDLFFEQNTPPPRPGRYTLEELKEIERKGAEAIANARATRRPVVGGAPAAPTAAAPAPPKPEAAAPPRPAAPTPTPAPPPKTSAATPLSGTPRVLIADDDEDFLQVVRTALIPDFEVITAINGIEAIERITTCQPDLVALDAMVPKMSGFQLCQSLRRNSRYARTPIMFISGKTTPKDREYAMRIGANDFLPKPFEIDELKRRLLALTQLPTFKVYPKALSYQAIEALDNRRRNELEERKDRLARKEESELEKFLREHGQQ
jgi:DNA-binding response OmpR family regulator